MNIPARSTSTTAILSFAFGLLAWITLPLLGSLAAIICGHIARGEIRRSNGSIDGDGFAIAGLLLGYLQLICTVLFFFIVLAFFGSLAAFIAWLAVLAA